MTVRRYSVAVDRRRSVAETCTRLASLWEDDPLVLDALGERRLGDLHRLIPTAAEEAEQLQEELAASLGTSNG